MARFEDIFLLEAARDKISRIERSGIKLSNHTKSLISKNEGRFDWNSILGAENPVEVLNQQIQGLTTDAYLASGSSGINKFIAKAWAYFRRNNYDPAFTLQFILDFSKKYKTTRDAIPEFKSFVAGDVYSSVSDKDVYGNLVKIYLDVEKSQLQQSDDSDGELKNKWIVIPSEEKDPENYEANVSKLMSFSSCKTGWCVRGSGMAKHYMGNRSDFHLYLDSDGDAVVSLRVIDDNVEEVSGTEDGVLQKVGEEYQAVTIKYINGNSYTMLSFDPDEFLVDFKPQSLVGVLESHHNYDDILKYINGDSYLEFYSEPIDNTEFIKEYLDEDLLSKHYMEANSIEDEDDFENEDLEEYLESEYDFRFSDINNRMYETTGSTQMYEALTEKADEVMENTQLEFVDPDDNKQGILWRQVYLKSPEVVGETKIELFFNSGQPSIQDEDGVTNDPYEYISTNMTDIDDPRNGWGEYDSDVLWELIIEEHSDLILEFGDAHYRKKLADLKSKNVVGENFEKLLRNIEEIMS
jgi:hypothetical protein